MNSCWFCPFRKDRGSKKPYCLLKQKSVPFDGVDFCNGMEYQYKKKKKYAKK